MDLTQKKLIKSEWNNLEISVNAKELLILKLIIKGYKDVNIKYNENLSLLSAMKITQNESIDYYLFNKYFKQKIDEICKKYNIEQENFKYKNKQIKKISNIDNARIENMDKNSHIPYTNSSKKNMIFEFLLIKIINELCKQYKKEIKNSVKKNSLNFTYYYYTLYKLSKLSILNVNSFVLKFVEFILNYFKITDMQKIIDNSVDMIECNDYLNDYADIQLYEHQKKIFTTFKNNEPKLVMYIAPTATGKTLTPIGLAETHKIIFVCAARHVGLALAKSAISVKRKIALAFDCKDAEDVRLHYFAVKEATRDAKSGNIKHVDNTVGDLVEIIICDIKSYLPAMYYMLAFNDKENCITYWDEPTITMDCESHPFHSIINDNWKNNLIPNIVLSSATLPKEQEISSVISDYKSRFGGKIVNIVSHDNTKSIPIMNRAGETYLPHHNCKNAEDIKSVVLHCNSYPTIMRYIDLKQVVKFILTINQNENINIDEIFKINTYFETIDDINMSNIKSYYLRLLKNIAPQWEYIINMQIPKYIPHESNIHIVTSDAYTLLNGPTIYLAEDVNKIAKFYLQEAKIPVQAMNKIMDDIKFNKMLNEEISKLEKDYEDGIRPFMEKEQENKINNLRIPPELRQLKYKIEQLRDNIKSTSLHDIFIPNRKEHIKKYVGEHKLNEHEKPFTCDISDSTIIQIMKLDDIDDSWKILLLMGIGVFTNHKSINYMEIMKSLAEQQKLFMIIASTDFIYGTNYQFCQGYIAKDLVNMTQEKAIQAMGRVGRNKIMHSYSVRIRDDEIINKLFNKQEYKPEVINMNKLFSN